MPKMCHFLFEDIQWKQRNKAEIELDMYDMKNTSEAQKRARSCYTYLANRLGTTRMRYFSRKDQPCSLDICAASRLALHLHFPVNDNPFKELLLREFPLLVQHTEDMLQTFAGVQSIGLITHVPYNETEQMPKLVFKPLKSRWQLVEEKKEEKKEEKSEEKKEENEEEDEEKVKRIAQKMRIRHNYIFVFCAVLSNVALAIYYRSKRLK